MMPVGFQTEREGTQIVNVFGAAMRSGEGCKVIELEPVLDLLERLCSDIGPPTRAVIDSAALLKEHRGLDAR
jgi:hypothetical protein